MDRLARIPMRSVLNARIHAATTAQVVSICDEAIRARQRLQIGVVNAAKLVNMRRNALLRDAVAGSDLVLADGMAVVWASRILGQPLPERVAGIDLFLQLLALANARAYSVFLLGASQQVLDKAVEHIVRRYPSLHLVGAHNGYFDEAAAGAIADDIRRSGADMLFVAMSPPRKELFLARWGEKLAVPVRHGVGGSFDVLAGEVKRAPLRWQRWGLEWLYRALQEPGRLWKRYAYTNCAFVLLTMWHAVSRRRDRARRLPPIPRD